jgi:hypothetical protein
MSGGGEFITRSKFSAILAALNSDPSHDPIPHSFFVHAPSKIARFSYPDAGFWSR